MAYINEKSSDYEERILKEHDCVLKHIIYNNEEESYYSYLPESHVVITDKNNKHLTINKTKLDLNNTFCTIPIGNIDFFCELLTRNTDDKVLLTIQYHDYEYNSMVQKKHLNELVKYVEILILGFIDYYIDYENEPNKFFCIQDNQKWETFGDGAW